MAHSVGHCKGWLATLLSNESSRVALTLPLDHCLVHAGRQVGGLPVQAYQTAFVVEVLAKEGLSEHVNERKL